MNEKWKFALISTLISLTIGLVFIELGRSGAIDDNDLYLPLLYLPYIDPIGIILCKGICEGFGGLTYLITVPISIMLYGFTIGFLYGKYKKPSKDKKRLNWKLIITVALICLFGGWLLFGFNGLIIGGLIGVFIGILISKYYYKKDKI
ncbi:hypothetical protein HYW20_05690 [Candidatus Woesearchaeota archaeon]|nr:hypothetical protein [Candidatus Woesearchaeota archaeon]